VKSGIDEPLPLVETGGVFALLMVVTRFSMDGEAKTDETRAEAARRAVEVFMMSRMIELSRGEEEGGCYNSANNVCSESRAEGARWQWTGTIGGSNEWRCGLANGEIR
jgi:hypothetical protein